MTREQLHAAIGSALERDGCVGPGYEWLRLTLRGCDTLEEAVNFCVEENFHRVARMLEASAKPIAEPAPKPAEVRERSVSSRRWWDIPRLRFWAR